MKHPECLKGNHLWIFRSVSRGTEIWVCTRCGEAKAVPRKGKK